MDSHATAGIVLIGDELLSGKIQDRNGALLIAELRALGVTVSEMHVVADEQNRIVEAINLVRPRNDFVFTSGGIGPTHDDRTMLAVAQAFDVGLEKRNALVEIIERYWGNDPDTPWMKMASVPAGCELIWSEGTRWPAYKMDNVFVLPGIPEVFQRQFNTLRDRFSGVPFHLVTIYYQQHEGEVARVLNEATDSFPTVALGSYPVLDRDDYKVRITIESRDRGEVDEALSWILERFDEADVFKVE